MTPTVVAVCDNAIDVSSGTPVCTGNWQVVATSTLQSQPFDPSMLDPDQLAGYFFVGFSIVVTFWAIGFACRKIISVVRAYV